jgi:hypothetical protein
VQVQIEEIYMKNNNFEVRLSGLEMNYLLDANFLPTIYLKFLSEGLLEGGGSKITLSGTLAEEFREIFTEYLAKVGFDGEYKATPEGNLLENLIDRFYTKSN